MANPAPVQDMLLGISEDGAYVYFVAKGALASGAVQGEDNLYVIHESGGGWTRRSSRPSRRRRSGRLAAPNGKFEAELVTSRVSSNGRYVTFMSDRSLTGYDNRDVGSGQPDEEVYLYDAEANRLACASCDPSGSASGSASSITAENC